MSQGREILKTVTQVSNMNIEKMKKETNMNIVQIVENNPASKQPRGRKKN